VKARIEAALAYAAGRPCLLCDGKSERVGVWIPSDELGGNRRGLPNAAALAQHSPVPEAQPKPTKEQRLVAVSDTSPR
jgi:hypothetical protein